MTKPLDDLNKVRLQGSRCKNCGEVAFDDFAEIDVDEVAILIDDRIQRIHRAKAPDDLELLLMQGIAD